MRSTKFLAILCACLLSLAACGDDDAADTTPGGDGDTSADVDESDESVDDDDAGDDPEVSNSVTEGAIITGLETVGFEVVDVTLEDGTATVELTGEVEMTIVCVAVGDFADTVIVIVDGEETEC